LLNDFTLEAFIYFAPSLGTGNQALAQILEYGSGRGIEARKGQKFASSSSSKTDLNNVPLVQQLNRLNRVIVPQLFGPNLATLYSGINNLALVQKHVAHSLQCC
jgi:hypothetical protein